MVLLLVGCDHVCEVALGLLKGHDSEVVTNDREANPESEDGNVPLVEEDELKPELELARQEGQVVLEAVVDEEALGGDDGMEAYFSSPS